MNTLSNIWRFETAQFVVTVDAIEEYDIDLSWDEDGEVARRLNSGELEMFAVRARCVHKGTGMEAEDYLGGCIYETPDAFRDHMACGRERRETGRNVGSSFSDMVRSVVAEMRANVAKARSVKLREAA